MKTLSRKIIPALITSAITLPAAAQNSLVLEEIIVTAQKRSESLSETPMTVNVVTGDVLEEMASFEFGDLTKLTSGLTIFGSGFDTNIATRGLGTDLNGPVTPRVTVYLDGSFISQQRALFSGIYDMQQVELLRGPQGTLYGQASPAGAITLRSRDPNLEEVDGYIQQSFTEHSGSNTQFGVSVPIIKDQLSIRLAGMYDKNENLDATNITLGKDLEREISAFRVVALWQATENLRLRLSYHDLDDEGDIDAIVKGNGIAFDDRTAVGDFSSTMEGETDYTILTADYNFTDNLSATLQFSHQDNVLQRNWDGDSSPVQGQEQFVLSDVTGLLNYEARLASQGNDFWDWTIGAFYQKSESVTPVIVQTFGAVGGGFVVQTETTGPAQIDADYYGYFTHNTIHLTDKDTLTVGLRYMEEDRNNRQTFTSITDLIAPIQIPMVDVRSQEGVAPEVQETSDDAVTGSLKYQHQFTDNFMAYASYDRGWRGGTTNISGSVQPTIFGLFDAEESDNFEVGYKWTVLEGRGLWNFAVYYQTYSDFQYQAEVEFRNADGSLGFSTPVVNIDEAEAYGFDSDFSLLISENWSFGAALSYNKTELSSAANVPCDDDNPVGAAPDSFNTCNFTGSRAGNQPEWSLNLNTEYSQPIGSGSSEWYVRALANAESEYFSTSEQRELDSYTTLDLFVGWRTIDDAWDARIWVKNAFDESAEINNEGRPTIPDYDNPAGGSIESGLLWVRAQLEPRTAGVTVSYNF